MCDAAEDKELDPATIRQIQAKLNKALRWAMSKGLTPEVVLPKLESEKTERSKKKAKALYSRDDLKRLLAAAKSVEDEALVMLAWHGALRIGEIPALQWADIDWSTKIMTIARNVYKSRVQDNPKGEVGPVPMSSKLIAVLQRMKRDDGSPWVFPPGRKTDFAWWTDPSARRRMQALQQEAGLPVLGPHRVRHSVLTHLANKNVSPYSLQAFARHANMRTTLDYYVHLQKAELAAVAVDVLDEEDALDSGASSKRGNAKRSRGEARGNGVAIAGNTAEFVDRVMNWGRLVVLHRQRGAQALAHEHDDGGVVVELAVGAGDVEAAEGPGLAGRRGEGHGAERRAGEGGPRRPERRGRARHDPTTVTGRVAAAREGLAGPISRRTRSRARADRAVKSGRRPVRLGAWRESSIQARRR